MVKFLVWFKGVFSTLNQFINNKLLIFEQNDRIKSIFESNAVDEETVNTVITMVIDVLMVIIFCWLVKKIVSILYKYLRRHKRRNQQRKSPKKYGNNAKRTRSRRSFRQKRNTKRRRGLISELFSKLKLNRKKKRKKVKYSYSNEYIDDNGKLSYNEYDDDYSYDYPEKANVQQHINHHSKAKNSDGENTIYIPKVDSHNNGNVGQMVYGNQNPNKRQVYRNGYTNTETDIYRAMPKTDVSECAEDTFDFSSDEQNSDDGKTRIFKRK